MRDRAYIPAVQKRRWAFGVVVVVVLNPLMSIPKVVTTSLLWSISSVYWGHWVAKGAGIWLREGGGIFGCQQSSLLPLSCLLLKVKEPLAGFELAVVSIPKIDREENSAVPCLYERMALSWGFYLCAFDSTVGWGWNALCFVCHLVWQRC